GARVTVISPEGTPELAEMAQKGRVIWERRDYRNGDQSGAFLVIGATDVETLNSQIQQEAEAAGRLCNIADQPERCNFVLPAVIQKGDLMIAVSTSGKRPAFAKHLRRLLEGQFGPEYAIFLDLMGAVRQRLLAEAHAPEAHKPIFEQLISRGLLELIRHDDRPAIDRILAEVVGPDFLYEDLLGEEA
ncbi:MAG: bifunctional precorrin-2 dehydrogenase/sirohydrochlorin ferrochelatase, partial [Desulfobacterales bacterium]|nr:bifunctional precorrin-2 dehydrogenase/sirohydrochlorin ferrochelatase [Desulfobacterales bacterium]